MATVLITCKCNCAGHHKNQKKKIKKSDSFEKHFSKISACLENLETHWFRKFRRAYAKSGGFGNALISKISRSPENWKRIGFKSFGVHMRSPENLETHWFQKFRCACAKSGEFRNALVSKVPNLQELICKQSFTNLYI